MNKRPALLAEDGAKFFGNIAKVESGYRATCHARIDHLSHLDIEAPQMRMFQTAEEAKAWIAAVAAHRGFKSWFDNSEPT